MSSVLSNWEMSVKCEDWRCACWMSLFIWCMQCILLRLLSETLEHLKAWLDRFKQCHQCQLSVQCLSLFWSLTILWFISFGLRTHLCTRTPLPFATFPFPPPCLQRKLSLFWACRPLQHSLTSMRPISDLHFNTTPTRAATRIGSGTYRVPRNTLSNGTSTVHNRHHQSKSNGTSTVHNRHHHHHHNNRHLLPSASILPFNRLSKDFLQHVLTCRRVPWLMSQPSTRT